VGDGQKSTFLRHKSQSNFEKPTHIRCIVIAVRSLLSSTCC
jgi:ribosomal protein S10